MGAGSAGRNGGGSPTQKAKDKAEKDRIAAAKTKTKFGYTKPKTAFEKTVDFVKKGGVAGYVIRKGKKVYAQTKERKVNKDLLGTSDYQGDVGTPPKGFTPDNRNAGDKAAIEQQVMDNTYYRNLKGSKYYREPKDLIIKTAGSTAPTEAELSQSAAADADDIYTRRKKSKARGRSMMTLTSSKGVTDNKLTLGKPSLLGK